MQISNEAVCRTALATPGLLKIHLIYKLTGVFEEVLVGEHYDVRKFISY